MSGDLTSTTDGLIEEELRGIVAGGQGGAIAREDAEIIAEASRRALGRAGLMIANAPSAAAVAHWEAVLGEIRSAGEQRKDGEDHRRHAA